ncbi:RDD family protein [Candidatus Saganbacteria bacterium]|uniref:RDD family protein n=1 Tax=Candidatus Saganbacteria bacterium TaxID=2575572 RepID=A0A9D6UL23_UNCSA|nr:RDD family protein [Candidatus Saganbacteria bacterium]
MNSQSSSALYAAVPNEKSPAYAGFIRRSLAFAIDSLIIASFIYLTGHGAVAATGPEGADGWHIFRLAALMGFFSIVFPFVYFAWFHANGGQTPGKKAVGIKVAGYDGGDVSSARCVFRTLAYPVSALFFFLGFLWPVFDRRGQAWHDKIAGTVVLDS